MRIITALDFDKSLTFILAIRAHPYSMAVLLDTGLVPLPKPQGRPQWGLECHPAPVNFEMLSIC